MKKMNELEKYRKRKCEEVSDMFGRGITEAQVVDFIAVMLNEIGECLPEGDLRECFNANLRQLNEGR